MNSSLPTAALPALVCVFLMLTPIATQAADQGEADFARGWDLLKQRQYGEARAALESGMKKNPSNALAHYYLAETCKGLKDWSCAEEHYEASLDLDAKSSVADLAKARLRKAKAWRLLDEAKRTITDSQAPPKKFKQAQDTLDVANKLGLDDEQQAVYQQLREKGWQGQTGASAGALKQEGLTGAAGQCQMQDASMAMVPSGEFIMGSDKGDDTEKPAHRVHLDSYCMDKYEVTVGQYAKFLEAIGLEPPRHWEVMNKPQHQKRPVGWVEWADAANYCRWAGKRLPTEAEWEKAARGTDGRTYPWGNDPPTRLYANYGKFKKGEPFAGWNNHAALNPVGILEDGKSPYGIYDMAGNFSEWVSDWYDKTYYQNSPSQNPKGPASGDGKVIRGGAWDTDAQGLRSAGRDAAPPELRDITIGFRCAKTP